MKRENMFPYVSISGYAGAGKTTISLLLASRHKTLWIPRITCRRPRKGEISGTEYEFLTMAKFAKRVPQMFEYHALEDIDAFTGIMMPEYWPKPTEEVDLGLGVLGSHVVELKEVVPTLITVFLTVPGDEELRRRLFYRNKKKLERHSMRNLQYAKEGIEEEFDHVVCNRTTPLDCVKEIEKIAGL